MKMEQTVKIDDKLHFKASQTIVGQGYYACHTQTLLTDNLQREKEREKDVDVQLSMWIDRTHVNCRIGNSHPHEPAAETMFKPEYQVVSCSNEKKKKLQTAMKNI